MKIGHLTLERILGPDPIPEFRYCSRCDIELKQGRVENECVDCDGLDRYKGSGKHGFGFPPVDPAYEVYLHYPQRPLECPTVRTLDALKIPYHIYTAKTDAIEVDWAKQLPYLGNKEDWPIVLISAHGEVRNWWAGFDLLRLNMIPAARAAAINHHTESFELTRVLDRELEMAA